MTKFDAYALFEAIDLMQGPPFGRFLAEDVDFSMASYPPVRGRQAAVDFVSSFQSVLSKSEHHSVSVDQIGDTWYLEGKIRYTLKNGKGVVIDFLNKLKVNEQRLAERYRVYIDPSPLLAVMKE